MVDAWKVSVDAWIVKLMDERVDESYRVSQEGGGEWIWIMD